MGKLELEMCELCGEETGMAGPMDDSIYSIWATRPPSLPSKEVGDEVGPLCTACYDCLNICGFIANEDET